MKGLPNSVVPSNVTISSAFTCALQIIVKVLTGKSPLTTAHVVNFHEKCGLWINTGARNAARLVCACACPTRGFPVPSSRVGTVLSGSSLQHYYMATVRIL